MRFAAYPKYKPSGIEWLGDVPEHWDVKRGRFCMDVNPSSSRMRTLRPEDEVSFVPMEAVGEYGGLELGQTRAIADVGSGYTEFEDGDVVVAKITPCFENGKGALATGLLNGAAFGTTELHVLRSAPILERRFLFYFSISRLFRSTGEGEMYGAGGQKRVPPEFCENVRLPLPPIDDQRAIAAFLDRETACINALIEKKRRLIELLQEKRQSLIAWAVERGLNQARETKDSGVAGLDAVPSHWTVAKLKRFATVLAGFAFPSAGFSTDEAQPRLLRGVNVGVGEITWADTVCWQREANDGLSRYELSEGAIVLGMDRPLIRGGIRVARIGKQDLPCLLLQRVAAISTNSELSEDFLYLVLRSGRFADYFTPELTGVSVPHISREQILDFDIPIPPPYEQAEIVAFVNRETAKIEALSARCSASVDLLTERRSAIVTAAVTGQIDVREAA